MKEQAHGSEGHSPISTGSVAALAQRFAIKALEASGHKEIAHWVKEWPEILGDKAGLTFQKLFAKKAKGEALTEQDKRDLAKSLDENPKEAAAFLGVLTADLLEGTLDAETERKAILDSYRAVFEIICAYLAKSKSSLALKGFLHDEHCISYWHFDRSNLLFSDGQEYLYPNGVDVYFGYEEPTDERLLELNLAIRDSPTRHLAPELFDFDQNDSIAKLSRVYETNIATARLRRDRENLPKPVPNPVFRRSGGTDYSRPVEEVVGIPAGAPALIAMVDSLSLAKQAQVSRYDKTKANSEEATGKRGKP
jgi:hypothetical protein